MDLRITHLQSGVTLLTLLLSSNESRYSSSTAFFIDPAGRIRLVFDALEDVSSAEKMLRENQAFFQ